VTGELERASETLELYRQAYPRDYRAASNLANVDSMLGHIYVRSERAGQRVMESVSRFITQRLKLKVNAATPILNRCHAHGLIAKIPHSRRWRLTRHGRITMAASIQLRDVQFPISHMKSAA